MTIGPSEHYYYYFLFFFTATIVFLHLIHKENNLLCSEFPGSYGVVRGQRLCVSPSMCVCVCVSPYFPNQSQGLDDLIPFVWDVHCSVEV